MGPNIQFWCIDFGSWWFCEYYDAPTQHMSYSADGSSESESCVEGNSCMKHDTK